MMMMLLMMLMMLVMIVILLLLLAAIQQAAVTCLLTAALRPGVRQRLPPHARDGSAGARGCESVLCVTSNISSA
jgi:outer membrane lipoprotein-sorting protein